MRAAAIDVGSNTCLLTVGEHLGEGRVQTLHDELAFTRLGTGVDTRRRLDPECRAAGLAALTRFAETAQRLHVTAIRAAGTSALRDAEDAPDFIAEVAAATGIQIEVIAGAREAALSFAAVSRTLPPGRLRLVVDIGGNSTEFIRGDEGGIAHAQSLDVGARRMTERFLASDPPAATEIAALDGFLDATLDTLPDDPQPEDIVAVAGTATTLAAMELSLATYDAERVHGTVLDEAALAALLERMVAVDTAARREMPGLNPKRADVIIAGHRILSGALRRFGAHEALVADRGIRHALLFEALGLADGSPVQLLGFSSGG